MPAPAVIPAPQAYTNVAVVKTFVVYVSVPGGNRALINGNLREIFSRFSGHAKHFVVFVSDGVSW